MVIAYDVSYIQTRRAGYGRMSLELLKGLLASGSSHTFKLHGWSFSLDLEVTARLQGPTTQIYTAAIPGAIKRFYWNTLRMPAVETFIGSFDIFHSAEPSLPPTDAKSIITVHDLAYKKHPEWFESMVVGWDRHVKRAVSRADCIIVPSRQTKSDVEEHFHVLPDRIAVVPNCVGEEFYVLKANATVRPSSLPPTTRPFVLFVGTIEPRKNLPLLLRAFGAVERSSDLDLVIVGKRGWQYEEVLKQMRTPEHQGRVHYFGYVRDEELASLYREALMLVYPSMYEGFGLPVAEAMAAGLPVITSNTSSLGEIGSGAARLIDPHDEEELSKAILDLAGSDEERNRLISLGLERAKSFTSSVAAAKVAQIYSSL